MYPRLHILINPDKKWKKIGYMSLCRYLWSSVMLAGPEVGDHFTLNWYNKMMPLLKFYNIGGFLENFFFADIFFLAVYT